MTFHYCRDLYNIGTKSKHYLLSTPLVLLDFALILLLRLKSERKATRRKSEQLENFSWCSINLLVTKNQ